MLSAAHLRDLLPVAVSVDDAVSVGDGSAVGVHDGDAEAVVVELAVAVLLAESDGEGANTMIVSARVTADVAFSTSEPPYKPCSVFAGTTKYDDLSTDAPEATEGNSANMALVNDTVSDDPKEPPRRIREPPRYTSYDPAPAEQQ